MYIYIIIIRIRKESVWRWWEFGLAFLKSAQKSWDFQRHQLHMEVSQNGGYPKIDGLQWEIMENPSING